MKLVYDKWIEHDGCGCPVPCGYVVDVEFDCGPVAGISMDTVAVAGGRSWDWSNYGMFAKVIRYRIHKPHGAEMLEQLIADLPVDAKDDCAANG